MASDSVIVDELVGMALRTAVTSTAGASIVSDELEPNNAPSKDVLTDELNKMGYRKDVLAES